MDKPLTTETISKTDEILSTPNAWLASHIKDQVSQELDGKLKGDETVTIHATIKKAEGDKDIVEVGKYSPAELYYYSDAPILGFANHIESLLKFAKEILTIDKQDIDFELRVVDLCHKLRELIKFFQISPAHDEIISTLQVLISSEENTVISISKLKGLINALELVNNRISFSEELLDKFCDALEDAKYDLNFPMKFSDKNE